MNTVTSRQWCISQLIVYRHPIRLVCKAKSAYVQVEKESPDYSQMAQRSHENQAAQKTRSVIGWRL